MSAGKSRNGKTTVARKIISLLEGTRNVKVTGSTGKACTLYLRATTLHSFAGIEDGRKTYQEIRSKIENSTVCMKRITETEVLFVDEISMISKKITDLIHRLFCDIRGCSHPFGGMQVIVAGDFYQLPPVAGDCDKGDYAFQSDIWSTAFGHTVILKEVMRKSNKEFIEVLGNVADGVLSDHTMEFLQALSRPLNPQDFGLDYIPKLFAWNDDCDFHNMTMLNKLEGNEVSFKARDSGMQDFKLKVPKVVSLKVGAPVMVTRNVCDNLLNGMTGVVHSFTQDGFPVVLFDQRNLQVVKPVSWFCYDSKDVCKVVGTRIQLPLQLAWGMTMHKSQGTSMVAAEVHAKDVFARGQLYVGLSRTPTPQTLCVIGINSAKILKPAKEVIDFYARVNESNHQMSDEFFCCKKANIETDENHEDIIDSHCAGVEENDFTSQEIEEIDKILEACFEEAGEHDPQNDEREINLQEVLEQLEELGEEFNKPPEDFDHRVFLQTLVEENYDELTKKANATLKMVLDSDMDQVKVFLNIKWHRLFALIKTNVKQNSGQVKRKNFTAHYGSLHNYLIDDESLREFAALLGINQCELHHTAILSSILLSLNTVILQNISQSLSPARTTDLQFLDVLQMPAEGRAKVRYCIGWALYKEFSASRNYVNQNLHTSDPSVQDRVKIHYAKKNLIEHLSVDQAELHEKTKFPETLMVLDLKKYDNGTLFYVSDSVFEFAMDLEQLRVNLINSDKLRTARGEMVSDAMAMVKENRSLKDKWSALYEDTDDEIQTSNHSSKTLQQLETEICDGIVTRYFKMGAAQFMRNFRRDLNVQKTEAHRKRVVEKARKVEERKDKVTLDVIRADSSEGKAVTHAQLVALLRKKPDVFQSNTYKQKELVKLCQLYDVTCRQSYSKKKIAERLIPKILSSEQMPCPDKNDKYISPTLNVMLTAIILFIQGCLE